MLELGDAGHVDFFLAGEAGPLIVSAWVVSSSYPADSDMGRPHFFSPRWLH